MQYMKAVQIHKFGAEDVLQYDDVPLPSPGPRELVIKIEATSVNHSDLVIRQNGNIHIGPQDLPVVLGRELAGTVFEVGSGVNEFAPGQRVVSLPAVQTRASGLPGSKEYTGCYAQYALARPQDCCVLPDGIDMVTGAATGWVSLTAWYVLQAGRLSKGDSLLIHSGGSGVGAMAIQFAKRLGAKVFTTTGGPVKCEHALELGADVAIDYVAEDFETEIRKLTGGRGVDVLIDTIGGNAYPKNLRILADGGRLVALGSLSGGAPSLLQDPPAGRSARRFSITSSLMEDPTKIKQLDAILELIEAGQLKVPVDSVFPLQETASAHRHIADRRNFGKVVLTV